MQPSTRRTGIPATPGMIFAPFCALFSLQSWSVCSRFLVDFARFWLQCRSAPSTAPDLVRAPQAGPSLTPPESAPKSAPGPEFWVFANMSKSVGGVRVSCRIRLYSPRLAPFRLDVPGSCSCTPFVYLINSLVRLAWHQESGPWGRTAIYFQSLNVKATPARVVPILSIRLLFSQTFARGRPAIWLNFPPFSFSFFFSCSRPVFLSFSLFPVSPDHGL